MKILIKLLKTAFSETHRTKNIFHLGLDYIQDKAITPQLFERLLKCVTFLKKVAKFKRLEEFLV